MEGKETVPVHWKTCMQYIAETAGEQHKDGMPDAVSEGSAGHSETSPGASGDSEFIIDGWFGPRLGVLLRTRNIGLFADVDMTVD